MSTQHKGNINPIENAKTWLLPKEDNSFMSTKLLISLDIIKLIKGVKIST